MLFLTSVVCLLRIFHHLCSSSIQELARGVRAQLGGLIAELGTADLTPMSLGLSHSLSRYKLKFSPEKVDTMIVQVSSDVLCCYRGLCEEVGM
jgi:RNA processing factor Prp31